MSEHLAHRAAVEAAGRYVHWGVVQISLTNLLIIVGMIILFLLALLLPFPGGRHDRTGHRDDQR